MNESNISEQTGILSGPPDALASQPSERLHATPSLVAQACPTCNDLPATSAMKSPSYVYAIGRIEPRFPSLSVEKEFAQATARGETKGLTDRQRLQRILTQPQNRYLVRQLCWVLTIEGMETYLLYPRDPADFALLVQSLRPTPNSSDLDVVIGLRGPVASPEVCNGLLVPIVAFDQIYSFDRAALIKEIPRPEHVSAEDFGAAAGELFDRIMLMTDNAGATDEHRALNYLAMRYQAIYANVAQAFGRNESLSAIHVRPSSLSASRQILDVVFSYTNVTTDVTGKFFVRVDVTEEFPFLTTRISPYFDR